MVVHRWVAFVLVTSLLLGVGMRYPILQPYLYAMVPWVFILWAFILLWWDGQKTWSYGIFVFSVLSLSYVIFVIGVRIGFPFGDIVYGSTLGQKIEGVPVSLSFLCLALVLATACFARMITHQTFFAIFVGVFSILLFVIFIESAAIKHSLWRWDNIHRQAPLQYYIGWMGMAALFHYLYHKLQLVQGNKISLYLFMAMIIFFIIL